jgi:UTP--glucose-1-phosphate uridylyltransferase
MKIRKAVFPAAGFGTRFLPATKAIPKEMLPLIDKPLIQYSVEEAKRSGLEEVIIITGMGKTAIEDHFDVSFELEMLLKEKNKTDMLRMIEELSNFLHKAEKANGARPCNPLRKKPCRHGAVCCVLKR